MIWRVIFTPEAVLDVGNSAKATTPTTQLVSSISAHCQRIAVGLSAVDQNVGCLKSTSQCFDFFICVGELEVRRDGAVQERGGCVGEVQTSNEPPS